MKALLKPLITVFAFIDGVIASVVHGEQLRRRVVNRMTITSGSSPDPNRRPRRR
ncbi:MAG: hypothetical protein OXE43_14825 [Chloroflexi bacterium]|nr:hypothetical protein [Chloroflexota bacterium]